MSIALPVYNGEKYLREAIRSVLAQNLPADEFKVYDNASTDRSVEIAASMLRPEQLMAVPENQGAAVNFQRAFRGARPDAEYFMWLAADDRLTPDFVAKCVAELEAKPQAPACLTGIRFIDPEGRPLREQADPQLANPEVRKRLRAFLRRPRWTEFYCLYRKSALHTSPGMTAEYGSDVHLTWWFLLRRPLAVVPDPLLEYREYPLKTAAEMAESLAPGMPPPRWVKITLWRHLWSMTREPGVSCGGVARQELLVALAHPTWLMHLAEDVLNRWPRVNHWLQAMRPDE